MAVATRWARTAEESALLGGRASDAEKAMDAKHFASFLAYGPQVDTETRKRLLMYKDEHFLNKWRDYREYYVPITRERYGELAKLPEVKIADVAGQPLLTQLYSGNLYVLVYIAPDGKAFRVTGVEKLEVGSRAAAFLHGVTVSFDETGTIMSPAVYTAEHWEKHILGKYSTYFSGGGPYGVDDRCLPFLEDMETIKAMIEAELRYAPHARLESLHPVWHRMGSQERADGPFGMGRYAQYPVYHPEVGGAAGGGQFLLADQIAWHVHFEHKTLGGPTCHSGYLLLDPIDFRMNGIHFCLRELGLSGGHYAGRDHRPSVLELVAGILPAYHARYDSLDKEKASDVGLRPFRRRANAVVVARDEEMEMARCIPRDFWEAIRAMKWNTANKRGKSGVAPVTRRAKLDASIYFGGPSHPLYLGLPPVKGEAISTGTGCILASCRDLLQYRGVVKGVPFTSPAYRLGKARYASYVYHFLSLAELGISDEIIIRLYEAAMRVGLIPYERFSKRQWAVIIGRARLAAEAGDRYSDAYEEVEPIIEPNTPKAEV